MVELTRILTEMLQANVISKKQMRTAVGKLWELSLHTKGTNAPDGCIWTKQVRHTLLWLLTFLKGETTGVRRRYSVQNVMNQLPWVTITWGASLYGMGGALQLNGVIAQYFAIQIDKNDEEVLGAKRGSHEGQQIWEALAGLISLRLWCNHWQGQRAKLQIRSDNVGALTMLTKLRGGYPHSSRESALDLGHAQWKPDLAAASS